MQHQLLGIPQETKARIQPLTWSPSSLAEAGQPGLSMATLIQLQQCQLMGLQTLTQHQFLINALLPRVIDSLDLLDELLRWPSLACFIQKPR